MAERAGSTVTEVHSSHAVPLVHPETGQPLWVRPRSTLFFIPFRIWPAIIVTVGALVTFLGFVSAV